MTSLSRTLIDGWKLSSIFQVWTLTDFMSPQNQGKSDLLFQLNTYPLCVRGFGGFFEFFLFSADRVLSSRIWNSHESTLSQLLIWLWDHLLIPVCSAIILLLISLHTRSSPPSCRTQHVRQRIQRSLWTWGIRSLSHLPAVSASLELPLAHG